MLYQKVLEYHDGDHQYTEWEMFRRIAKIDRKVRKLGGVDVIVTHAPPYGVGDADDPAHHGFECFREMIELYKPKYLIHGHVHLRYGANQREREYEGSKVVNVSERYVIEVPDNPFPEKKRGEIIWKTKHKD